MDEALLYEALGGRVLTIALSMTRVASVFVLMPLFTRDGIPALIRNAMFLALTIIVVVVQPPADFEGLGTAEWISLFVKEALIGVSIGVFFGIFLWAFEAAGTVVDMQIGSSFALFFDPIVGNEVTLIGQFLQRWSSYLFVAAGGLLLVTGTLVESFAVWPVTRPVESFRMASAALFEAELSRFMSLTVRIAGPIMAALLVVDISMGLINRFAQQFNVFFLSTSVKSMAGVLMLLLMLPYLATLLLDELAAQPGRAEAVIERVIGR